MSRKGVAHHCGRCGEPGHHAPRCPHPEGQARIPSASGRAAWREALAALAEGDEPPAAVVAQHPAPKRGAQLHLPTDTSVRGGEHCGRELGRGAALEPARAEAPAFKLCPVVHSATRIPCELERGHLGEHRAELAGGVVQAWIGAGATGWRRASATRCDAPSGVEPAGYTCGRDPGHPAEHMAEIDSGKFAVWERPGRRNIYIEEIRRPVPLSSPEVAETLRRASFGALPKFASEPLATPDDAHRRVRHGLDVTPEPRPHVPTESAGADGARAAGAGESITPKAEALLASIAAGCDRALADLQDKTDHGTGEQDQKRSGTPDTCSPVASTADESSHHGDPGAGEGAEVAAERSTARRGRPSGRFRRALTARNTVKARRKASARPKKCEEGD